VTPALIVATTWPDVALVAVFYAFIVALAIICFHYSR
jgi:hypothetical protein